MYNYYMPTKIYWGKDIIKDNRDLFKKYGNKVLIVTGNSSAKKNGSIEDVKNALDYCNIEYKIYDKIDPNPSIENVVDAANSYMEADFVIGIGGGSPIDAAKAISILIKNKLTDNPRKAFWDGVEKEALPVIAIPTTSGTGTEVTPYAVLTDHQEKTKKNFAQKVFPDIAFFEVRYFKTMPISVRVSTAVDALSHLVESYLSVKSNILNEYIAEEGLRTWGKCKNELLKENISDTIFEGLMKASMLGGIAITNTGTSIPHGMGYALTYFEGLTHGFANGVLLKEYMSSCKDKEKVNNILKLLDFSGLEDFGKFIKSLIGDVKVPEENLKEYAKQMAQNTVKLKNHPDPITLSEIEMIYIKSLT